LDKRSDTFETETVMTPFLKLPTIQPDGRFRTEPSAVSQERTFGGRLACEVQLAASLTVADGLHAHSTHVHFLRPGEASRPTFYAVESLKDGRSFCVRSVRATQDDNLICIATVSFARERPTAGRQPVMPIVPTPDSLPPDEDLRSSSAVTDPHLRRYLWGRAHPVEFRHVDLLESVDERRNSLRVWFRAAPGFMNLEDAGGRAALLAYASDRYVMMTSTVPHLNTKPEQGFVTASLDHTLWIHRDYEPGGWLLHEISAVTDAGSRAFLRGEIFTEDGRHVASVAQEGLLAKNLR
jgi:acyl-CoA thioesterase II